MSTVGNLVVGIDLSGQDHLLGRRLRNPSRCALERAVRLARDHGARLHVLTALEVVPHAEDLIRADDALGRGILPQARARLGRVVDAADGAGLPVTTEVCFGDPCREVMRDVLANDRDMVVVGTRERGAVARNLLGSTALGLLRRAPVPVWIARPARAESGGIVLAPVEFGDLAASVLTDAAWAAADLGAHLHVLHVIDDSGERVLRSGGATPETVMEYRRDREAAADETLGALLESALPGHAGFTVHLDTGRPTERILALANDLPADAVVMGSVVHSEFASLLLGSTAEAVLPAVHASLLVVKPANFVTPPIGEA